MGIIMLKIVVEVLKKWRTEHEKHRDALKKWKQKGGTITGFAGQTIDDLIKREEKAIAELSKLIDGK
jgi:hypothetical protein